MLTPSKWQRLRAGTFIPANPLCLTPERTLDTAVQRKLVRYYLASGVGGLAVGVHTTQFAIREHGLYEEVLRISAQVTAKHGDPDTLLIAGVAGPTAQAVNEAKIARDLGYDLVLVSCGNLPGYSEDELIERTRLIGEVLPVFGFYLQPAASGRLLSADYWRKLADLPCVAAIKMAPFNRYQTLDVVRGVCESPRYDDITLYTGNDDNIIVDLLAPYRMNVGGKTVKKRIVGGLLGHWSVWTHAAVEYFNRVKAVADVGGDVPPELFVLANEITDCNGVFFDAANNFAGCIAGLHDILVKQGLMQGRWCLDPAEDVSPGQIEGIDRVRAAYPHLCDDDWIAAHIHEWED